MGRIFRQHTAGVAGRGFLPSLLALPQFGGWDFECQLPFLSVYGDLIAVLHEGNRAADAGFGRDVANKEPVAAAAEASVGVERHVFVEDLYHYLDMGGG